MKIDRATLKKKKKKKRNLIHCLWIWFLSDVGAKSITETSNRRQPIAMLLTAPDCFSSSHLPFASIKNSTAAVILKRFRLNSVSRTGTSRRLCRASLITSPDSFEVGRLIGSYGFMNITRLTYNNFPFFLFFFFFF